MNEPLLIILGIVIILVIYVIIKKSKKKVKRSTSIFDNYTEHGKVWVKKMWDMHMAGFTWDKDSALICDIYEKTFGIDLPLNQYGTKVSAYWKDIGVHENYLHADETSLEYKIGDLLFWLEANLRLRWQYQYKPLTGKTDKEVMKEFGLNVYSNEILYYNSIKIDWYDEQTISTHISYSGFRYKSGGHMSFNTGTFNVIKNNITGYVLLERGSLYITNKRIIFIGNESRQNRTINLDDILELSIYKDGVLLGKSNGKQPLIVVPDYQNSLVPRDDLNRIIRVLYRVMSGNQNEDLTHENF
ncbi:MAG: hypothetical protein ACR2FN_05890 [Chitinophagaceae bacterium]